MDAYVIYHKRFGIFLGSAMGFGFWSKLDPVGQNSAVTFSTKFEAALYLSSWATPTKDCTFVKVKADIIQNKQNFASIAACVAAGLPSWNPLESDTLNKPVDFLN